MARKNPPDAIDVPYVGKFLAASDVVSKADFLLTMLLRQDAGLLHADFADDGGKWHVRGWTSDTSGPDEVVAVTEKRSDFRTILARFGHHCMHDQLYGGFAEVTSPNAASRTCLPCTWQTTNGADTGSGRIRGSCRKVHLPLTPGR
jgi:hypothetical protein